MNTQRWLSRLSRLLDAAGSCEGEPADLRNLTFGVYRLLEIGGNLVQDAFQRLGEEELTREARAIGESLSAGRYLRPVTPATLDHGVHLAAQLLRGLEAALLGLGSLARRKLRSKDFAVAFDGDNGWLLPFPPRNRGELRDWPPYFARRGLARHRCLSRALPSGHEIDLHFIDHGFADEITAAACLFPTVSLLDGTGRPIVADAGPFVVEALAARDANALSDALAGACAEGAHLVVFPELSIRPEDRAEIVRLIRTSPWDEKLTGRLPGLVVAGSWHDRIKDGPYAGAYRNIAPVYDEAGNGVGRHIKHAPYGAVAEGEPFRENIRPGTHILVVASRTLTIAFAICLDFCQRARANPYDDLDVDLVVVTSLGGETTTRAHAVQSDRIWDRRKAATFLAQQADDAPFGVSGAKPDSKGFAVPSAKPVVVRKVSRRD